MTKKEISRQLGEGETVTYEELSLDFSAQTLQARKEWNQIFKLLSERNYQPRIR